MDELDELQASLAKDLSCVGIADFKGHCFKCKEPVSGSDAAEYSQDGIRYLFHQTCFTCEMCTLSLCNKPFYMHKKMHVCSDCYMKKVLGSCHQCGLVFTDPTIVKTDGKQFHPKCFCCSTCQKQLVSTFIEKDGSFVCKECYEVAFLPLCHGCNLRILPEKGAGTIVAVEWKDKKYHQACFSCKNCRKPFEDLKAVAHNDYLYCKECFEDEATRNAS